jgi:hypothetical protein
MDLAAPAPEVKRRWLPSGAGKGLRDDFRLNLLFVLAAVLALHGAPVPYNNEWLYQLHLIKQWHPDFLANDWTFASNSPEHRVFNTLVGSLTLVIPPTPLAWLGRLLGWALNAWALFRLGRRFRIPAGMISASLILWLILGQALVGGEWVFGSFEAKVFAFPLLFLALDGLMEGRVLRTALGIGLCFSLHPAVGLWGGFALGFALPFAGWRPRDWGLFLGAALLTAMPGILPLLPFMMGGDGSVPEDWKYLALINMPHHLDPFSWPVKNIAAVYLLFFANAWHAYRNRRDANLRLLFLFQAGTALAFTAGIGLRYAESYGILKFMPFRLFPLLTPLFFFFAMGHAYRHARKRPDAKTLAAAGLAGILVVGNPFKSAFDILKENQGEWLIRKDGFDRAAEWMAANTPPGATAIMPPWRNEAWYLSQRGMIAHYRFHPYDRLGEWRERVREQVGVVGPGTPREKIKAMESHYLALTPEDILSLSARYHTGYLVSAGAYPFPELFRSGAWRVYALERGDAR